MPRYDYECENCSKSKIYTFEADLPLKDSDKKPKCPKCKSNTKVKKVVITAFPKMQSWRTY